MKKVITEKYRKYFSLIFNLESYKAFLLEDFKENKDFAYLASSIMYYTPQDITNWVKGIIGNDFFECIEQTFEFEFDRASGIDIVNNISYNPYYFKEGLDDLYAFFSHRTYDTYEEAANNYPQYEYFMEGKDMYEKLNTKLSSVMVRDGYETVKRGKYSVKKIADSSFIKLIYQQRGPWGMVSGIERYRFPNIVVMVNGIDISPAFENGVDMRHFLLLRGNAFLFFYRERQIMKNADGQWALPGTTLNKTDEPVIYEHDGQYTISNSIEKLAYYNKYIFIVLELYCHYFKVFEKWLVHRLGEIRDEL